MAFICLDVAFTKFRHWSIIKLSHIFCNLELNFCTDFLENRTFFHDVSIGNRAGLLVHFERGISLSEIIFFAVWHAAPFCWKTNSVSAILKFSRRCCLLIKYTVFYFTYWYNSQISLLMHKIWAYCLNNHFG